MAFDLQYPEIVRIIVPGPPGPQGPPGISGPQATTLFVRADGDNANDGLSAGSSLATVSEAVARLKARGGSDNDSTTIDVAGIITEPTTLSLDRDLFRHCTIAGPVPAITTFAITALTGSLGNYIATATVGASSGLAVGAVALFHTATGADDMARMYEGAWVVTEVTDATHIKFRHTSWDARLPASGVSGTLVKFSAQLNFAGCTGIQANYGNIANLAIKGDEAGGETFGIRQSDDGMFTIGGYFAANGFATEGVRADYSDTIDGLSITMAACSNMGNNGWMARGTSSLKVANCISSGNGFRNIGGGGDGFLAQITAHVFVQNCLSAANFGVGFYARNASDLHCQNASNCISVCDDYGYRSSELGHIQANDSKASFSRNAGYFKDASGSMLATNANALNSGSHGFWAKSTGYAKWTTFQSTNAGSNGVMFEDGAQGECNSGTVTAPLHNGVVSQRGAIVEASGINVVSVGAGGTPYLARLGGQMLRTTVAGLPQASPAVNTVGPFGEFITTTA